jgi:chromosome partitioning protein
MAKVVAFSNQKGGVGKTTSCVNLAAAIGKKGKKVLIIDMDPQGNATTGVNISKRNTPHNVYEALLGECDPSEAVVRTNYKNLWVMPSTLSLAGVEYDLHEMGSHEGALKEVLAPILPMFDYIFIDCPPSLGMITVAALTAADGVVNPMQCEFFAMEGLSQLLMTVKKVRQHSNPRLEIVGILLTMYNGRLTQTRQVVDDIKRYYADKLFSTPITRNVKLSEAPSYGEPICYHDPYGKGALEYADVAKELMLRI